jgi:hypothetical protein
VRLGWTPRQFFAFPPLGLSGEHVFFSITIVAASLGIDLNICVLKQHMRNTTRVYDARLGSTPAAA